MKYNTIIILDDNPTTIFYNQDVMQDVFPLAEILTFEDCDVFIEAVRQDESKFGKDALLLLDINMPNKMGYEVLDILEEEIGEFSLNVIMVTSSTLKSDIEKSSRFSNIIGYIEKPITEDKLRKVLSED